MVGYKLLIQVRESWVNHGYKLLNREKKIATVSRQINLKELFSVWGNDSSEMSPPDTDQAPCDEERHEGDWRRETRGGGGGGGGGGGCVEREIGKEHPLCVNQQGLWRQRRTRGRDRVLLNNKESLSVRLGLIWLPDENYPSYWTHIL